MSKGDTVEARSARLSRRSLPAPDRRRSAHTSAPHPAGAARCRGSSAACAAAQQLTGVGKVRAKPSVQPSLRRPGQGRGRRRPAGGSAARDRWPAGTRPTQDPRQHPHDPPGAVPRRAAHPATLPSPRRPLRVHRCRRRPAPALQLPPPSLAARPDRRRRHGRWPTPPIPPGMHFRDLRHTHKTWLIEDRVPEVVQHQRMGHRFGGVMGTYSHVTCPMIDDLLAALQTRWEQASARWEQTGSTSTDHFGAALRYSRCGPRSFAPNLLPKRVSGPPTMIVDRPRTR